MQNDTVGIILALVSTLTFAASNSILSRPLMKSSPAAANFVGLVVGTILAATAAILFGQFGSIYLLTPLVGVLLALVGLFHFNVSRLLNFTALKEIGANQTSPLTSTQILYSVILGVLFLKETLTLAVGLGAALIAIGVSILKVGEGAKIRGGRNRRGLAAALSAGLIWGVSPVVVSYALSIYPDFLTATFVSYLFALVSYIPVVSYSNVTTNLAGSSGKTILLYSLSGIFLVTSQSLRFGALRFSPVVLVVPILATVPVAILFYTWLIAKEVEAFQRRTILSIVLCVIGTILVSLGSI